MDFRYWTEIYELSKNEDCRLSVYLPGGLVHVVYCKIVHRRNAWSVMSGTVDKKYSGFAAAVSPFPHA